MHETKTLTAGAMDGLRRKYAKSLREREGRIQSLIDLAATQNLTPEQKFMLRDHAHSLLGSGGTYGYPDISKMAQRLEESIESGAPAEVYILHAKKLVDICRSVSATQPPPLPQSSITPLHSESETRSKTLLVIDDDPSIHELIKELFKGRLHVHCAKDAHIGLEMIRREHPGLVLLDGLMPGMKGLTLLETLHEDTEFKDINVVMLTAHAQSNYVKKAISAGAMGYIAKPVDPVALFSRITNIFKRLDTTILIADDDQSIRDLLWEKFHSTGIKLVQAGDGETALALAIKHKPKLAILDWVMPGLSGFELLGKLKKMPETKNMKILMLTAKSEEDEIFQSLNLGAKDYIIKPFIADDVVARCLRLLNFTSSAE